MNRIAKKGIAVSIIMASLLLVKAHAQSASKQVSTDTLRRIMAMPDNKAKVAAYFKYANRCYDLWRYKTDYFATTANQIKQLSERLNDQRHVLKYYFLMDHVYEYVNNYPLGFDYVSKALDLSKKAGTKQDQLHALGHMVEYYQLLRDYPNALKYLKSIVNVSRRMDDSVSRAGTANCLSTIASVYSVNLKDAAQALPYDELALATAKKTNSSFILAHCLTQYAWDELNVKNYSRAWYYEQLAFRLNNFKTTRFYGLANYVLANLYRSAPDTLLAKMGATPPQRSAKALDCFKTALLNKPRNDLSMDVVLTAKDMSDLYAGTGNYREAYNSYKQYILYRDTLNDVAMQKVILQKQLNLQYGKQRDSLKFREQLSNIELKAEKRQSYYFIAGMVLLLALSAFIGLNYRNQRRSNKLLADANIQIASQRDELSDTVANLKATQQQLVQAEKMASLGELTAGIAHEIQNPLNFVNNFSEVSQELAVELNEELDKGDIDEARAIAGDIKQNLEKIHHHGKRADSIVKGMLEHSRSTTGIKEPTDLNKLADEYLRLAYHGMRAKDKSFNADLVTHFDSDLPIASVIPQDIGRVLINLFNNAFYAVQQKQKTAGNGYKPTVELATMQQGQNIILKVKDNGTGIPDAVKEKIMQPFFTTKPTGQGTGLGLSLSYDIIVKLHGGKFTVHSKEGEGAEFVIEIPC